MRHLLLDPVSGPAVAQVHLQVLLRVFCPVQDRVDLPVLLLMRRQEQLSVLTRAVFLFQVPVRVPVLSRAPSRVQLPTQRLEQLPV